MRRVLLALLILAASCAGERPTLEEAGASREVDTSSTQAPTDAEVTVRPVFRVALGGEWTGDPADAGAASLTSRVLADFLFEGLARLDTDGEPVPGLAERWFVSDDRTMWTFVLPVDLTDGLGLPVTARDVKRSLESVAARGSADQAATALAPVLGWTDHVNGDSGGVAGISAPDETTLVIRLDAPFEFLPSVLASPAFGITGETEDGRVRTTGAFRHTDDPDLLAAVGDDHPVGSIEIVRTDVDPAQLIADGLVDWAVLSPNTPAEGLSADVLRQPLDLEVVLVARMSSRAERIGLLSSLGPILLVSEIESLSPRAATGADEEGVIPVAALLDVPSGMLDDFGTALAAQLEAAGIEVVLISSDPADFAARVASGDAIFFPAVVAGGIGAAGGILGLATPGSGDDMFGAESDVRTDLAEAAAAEQDPRQRELFVEAMERNLIDEGLLLPVGQFEVRVAVATTISGLHHRVDGTIDLSDVTIDRSGE